MNPDGAANRGFDHLLREALQAPGKPADACPEASELAAFLEGSLPAAERDTIVAHLAACDGCQRALAQADLVPPAEPVAAKPRLSLVRWLLPATAVAGAAVVTFLLVQPRFDMGTTPAPASTIAGRAAESASPAPPPVAPAEPTAAREQSLPSERSEGDALSLPGGAVAETRKDERAAAAPPEPADLAARPSLPPGVSAPTAERKAMPEGAEAGRRELEFSPVPGAGAVGGGVSGIPREAGRGTADEARLARDRTAAAQAETVPPLAPAPAPGGAGRADRSRSARGQMDKQGVPPPSRPGGVEGGVAGGVVGGVVGGVAGAGEPRQVPTPPSAPNKEQVRVQAAAPTAVAQQAQAQGVGQQAQAPAAGQQAAGAGQQVQAPGAGQQAPGLGQQAQAPAARQPAPGAAATGQTKRAGAAPAAPGQPRAAAPVMADAVEPQGKPNEAGRLAREKAMTGATGLTAPLRIGAPGGRVLWRVNPDGTTQKSLDGGNSWQSGPTGMTGAYLAGSAPSETTCWLVGRGGLVANTSDGERWSRRPFPETSDLVRVEARDARSAVVTTTDGRRFSTSDGGATWAPLRELP